ncbi:MAG: DUF4337 family protein [Stellaceae bacterium]
MEPSEIADAITGEEEAHQVAADTEFRKLTGIYLGFVAMLLAITTLGGSNATKVMLNANIQASDSYGYYQSKAIRQTSYRLAAAQLDALIAAEPGIPPAARVRIGDMAAHWRAIAERYQSDPAGGRGLTELLASARSSEARRDRAARRDPNFDFAAALFQIAIVLGSVAIVAASRPLVKLSGGLALLGTLLMVNGYFLLVHFPLE